MRWLDFFSFYLCTQGFFTILLSDFNRDCDGVGERVQTGFVSTDVERSGEGNGLVFFFNEVILEGVAVNDLVFGGGAMTFFLMIGKIGQRTKGPAPPLEMVSFPDEPLDL